MHWAIPSMGSSILFAVVSVFDKRILAAHVRSLPSFYFVFGCLQVLIGIGAASSGRGKGQHHLRYGRGLGQRATVGRGPGPFFYGIQRLEVSRVVPVFHTFPVSTAILAVFLLDEKLLLVHWLAILVVVAGAGSLALEQGSEKGPLREGVGLSPGIPGERAYRCRYRYQQDGPGRNGFLERVCPSPNVAGRGSAPCVPSARHPRPGEGAVGGSQRYHLHCTQRGVLAFFAIYVTLVALDLGPASLVATVIGDAALLCSGLQRTSQHTALARPG